MKQSVFKIIIFSLLLGFVGAAYFFRVTENFHGTFDSIVGAIGCTVTLGMIFSLMFAKELRDRNTIKNFVTKVKRDPIYGDTFATEGGCYWPYVGSKAYVKLFGLIWVRYKKIVLIGKNH